MTDSIIPDRKNYSSPELCLLGSLNRGKYHCIGRKKIEKFTSNIIFGNFLYILDSYELN